VIVPYIIPPSGLGGITSSYIMLLDADGTGTVDTHFNNIFRFDSFTCDVLSGCPNPAGQVTTFHKTSGSGFTFTSASVPDIVVAGGKHTISITTTTLG
jgi:hypothetical protein